MLSRTVGWRRRLGRLGRLTGGTVVVVDGVDVEVGGVDGGMVAAGIGGGVEAGGAASEG